MRLTKKDYCGYDISTRKEQRDYTCEETFDVLQKLGQLEDILEKHEITDIEELDKILDDYDEQALFIISVSLFLQQKGLVEEFSRVERN